MRVLVTGAAGFIGHHVAKHLEDCGHEVHALVRCGKVGRLDRLQEIGFQGKVLWHDLRSPYRWNERTYDVVLHMAGETHVDRSIQDPADFVMSNVLGTTHLLTWAKDHASRFIQFSTDEVFGPALDGWSFDELDPHNPRNPYAASKSGAEQMVKAFANTYRMNCCVVRGMNVFGERQHPEKWVPTIIRKILRKEIITIHADPTKTKAGSRFYIYAGNVAKALELVLQHPNDPGPFHVVGEKEIDNLDMVNRIAGIMGYEQYLFEMTDFHSSRPGHDLRYAMQDNDLALLGWKVTQSFEESLEKTVNWYMEHKEWL